MTSEERLKKEQEEREKQRGTPHKVAISGYGVPRPVVLPPPRKVPEDLPPVITQWLEGEKK